MNAILKRTLAPFFISFVLASCTKEETLQEGNTTPSLQSNKPPVANAGNDINIFLPVNTTILDGSSSADSDGNLTAFAWTKISGPFCEILNANEIKPEVINLVEGTYQFKLEVTDNGGLSVRDTVKVIVNAAMVTVYCENRPVTIARLVPLGLLSQRRIGLVSATVGNKILFAGGMVKGAYSSRVDIYDITTNSWSIAELSKPERQGMAVASVGNKILFAGGGDNDMGDVTSRVDIYDASTNKWSIAELSKAREYLSATTLGNKVFFAGGGAWEPNLKGSTVVDIYDNITDTWSTATLSEGRMDHTATVVGDKIYFAGGTSGYYTSLNALKSIDIYDGATNSWSTSSLEEPRFSMAGISVDNKIFWAAGYSAAGLNTGFTLSNRVEIKDVHTGTSSFTCIIPRSQFEAVIKENNVVFFTGNYNNDPLSGTHFEIYNITSNTWSTGVLPQSIYDATIISVNNTIYVAGGRDKALGPYFNQVWKLEF